MEVAGYTFDVYCDTEGCLNRYGDTTYAQFYAQTYGQCKKQARAKGWKWVKRDGETINLCPKCATTGIQEQAR